MASFQDSQVEPVPVNTPVSAPVSAHVSVNKQGFLNGYVDIIGVRIPNVVLIILLVVIGWYLLTGNNTVHSLTHNLVGGALETSSSPTSSFFDNIHL
jgi:hypothetical protein